ncbi:MAG: NAD-dependent epimerase/dehydratase family protein [Anaerolineae bacterium]
MVKALVTGGTGFVGSHIVRALLAAGHSVRVLHRTTSKLDALTGLQFESAMGDLDDLDALKAACDGCEWVFHVAAVADYWRADRTKMFKANVDGTRHICMAAQQTGVKRVIFTSSAAGLGMNEGRPSDETTAFNLSPDDFPYGYSKALAEHVVAEFVADGLDVVTVNPVVVMGPGDLNMISGSFITQIKQLQWLTPLTSGGLAVVDVRDVARGHLAAAERGRTGERYILGATNIPYTQWFAMIAETVGVAKPFIMLPDVVPPLVARAIDLLRSAGIETVIDANQARLGTRKVYFNYDKAWSELGTPQIDMRQSLHDTYAWYLAYGYIQETMLENAIRQIGKLIGIRR